MATSQKILMAVTVFGLLIFLLLIFFGEKGFNDYLFLKAQKKEILKENEMLVQKNISLYHRIERLKNDPIFAEYLVRKELGVVGKEDLIFKKAPVSPRKEIE